MHMMLWMLYGSSGRNGRRVHGRVMAVYPQEIDNALLQVMLVQEWNVIKKLLRS